MKTETKELPDYNKIRVIDQLQSGKTLISLNERTSDIYEIKFTKVNKSSFKVSFYDGNEKIKEGKIFTSNSKISAIFFKSLYSFYFVNEKLHIVVPEEICLYEKI